jgi:hypothetical protein
MEPIDSLAYGTSPAANKILKSGKKSKKSLAIF